MKNFTLPTPQEVDYYQDSKVDDALEKIRSCINQKVFRFKPNSGWNFWQMQFELKRRIGPFGWTIKTSWVGGKEDGYDTWVLEPLT